MAISKIGNSGMSSGAALSNLGSSQLADANMAPGSVIQVVSATFTTPFTTTSTSYVDTGISLSITPSSASSKILVFSKVPVRHLGYGYGSIRWLRGATTVSEPNTAFETGITTTGADLRIINSYMFLDSPATTSSITYKAQAVCLTADAFYIIPNNNQATVILMEIAA